MIRFSDSLINYLFHKKIHLKIMNLNGRILFEGKSPINGKPIVIIATGFKEKSANPKTGFMLQTWVLSSQLKPNEAFKTNEN